MLQAQNLSKKYGKRQVIKDISFEVQRGQVVGLLGPNGSGKTTTFYMVVGLVASNSGTITLNGVNITKLPIHKRAQYGLSYLPQEFSLFRKMTVSQNILSILQLRKDLNRQQQHRELAKLLADFQIEYIRNNGALSLSGGERRRVEIARALASNPDFVLLDEPFAGVDPVSVAEINNIITTLREQGLGVLITDHNVRETMAICQYIYVINDGLILAAGTATELIQNPQVQAVYLGDDFHM